MMAVLFVFFTPLYFLLIHQYHTKCPEIVSTGRIPGGFRFLNGILRAICGPQYTLMQGAQLFIWPTSCFIKSWLLP